LFTGKITNSGTVSSEGANGTVGGFRAVNGVSFQGELDNSGTISGTQNGVYFGVTSETVQFTLTQPLKTLPSTTRVRLMPVLVT